MEAQEPAPRLWRRTAPAPRVVCLVDPLVPEGEEERFWRALDAPARVPTAAE